MKYINNNVALSLLLALCVLAAHGFESRFFFRNIYEPIVMEIDMTDSTYRYCRIEYADSIAVIGKEISHGSICATDSTLSIYSPEIPYSFIGLERWKKFKRGMSKIFVDDFGSESPHYVGKLIFYGSEKNDSIEYVPDYMTANDTNSPSHDIPHRIPRFFSFEIPMLVDAMKVVYNDLPPSPIFNLKGVSHESPNIIRNGAVIHPANSDDFNCIWLKIRNYPPDSETFFLTKEDTTRLRKRLRKPGFNNVIIEQVQFVREPRKVLIYRDDTSMPYIQK